MKKEIILLFMLFLQSCITQNIVEKRKYEFFNECSECNYLELNCYTKSTYLLYKEPTYLLNNNMDEMEIDSSLHLHIILYFTMDLDSSKLIEVDFEPKDKINNELAKEIEQILLDKFNFKIEKSYNSKPENSTDCRGSFYFLPYHLILKKGMFY